MPVGGATQAEDESSPRSADAHDQPDTTLESQSSHTNNPQQQDEQDTDIKEASNPPLPQEDPPSEAATVVAATTGEQQEPSSTTAAVEDGGAQPPPLPDEEPPPLPDEPLPQSTGQQATGDDGWQPVWDAAANTYYFYNRFTHATQWENPRVPSAQAGAAAASNHDKIAEQPQYTPGTEPAGKSAKGAVAGGYNPAIHGDYDPNADYAQVQGDNDGQDQPLGPPPGLPGADGADPYAATAAFNRYTGRFSNTALHPTHTPDQHTDEAKSRRQMSAFFDVDAAANAHGGRSLRAERQERRLSKRELQAFQARRRARKEEKRRAWLRD